MGESDPVTGVDFCDDPMERLCDDAAVAANGDIFEMHLGHVRDAFDLGAFLINRRAFVDTGHVRIGFQQFDKPEKSSPEGRSRRM